MKFLHLTVLAAFIICASSSEQCWRRTYGRGVGVPITTCPGGFPDRDGLLCYRKCRPGYSGVGPVCWQNCKSGFKDNGAFCLKPKAYGRGAGSWSHCGGCEKNGWLWYPKCRGGYHNVGCCICSPNCSGYKGDIGISCTKHSYGRGAGKPLTCRKGLDNDAGLCYKHCRKGFHSVGPVCWQNCPRSMPIGCAAGCATTKVVCSGQFLEIATAAFEVAASIVEKNPFGVAAGVLAAEGALHHPLCPKNGKLALTAADFESVVGDDLSVGTEELRRKRPKSHPKKPDWGDKKPDSGDHKPDSADPSDLAKGFHYGGFIPKGVPGVPPFLRKKSAPAPAPAPKPDADGSTHPDVHNPKHNPKGESDKPDVPDNVGDGDPTSKGTDSFVIPPILPPIDAPFLKRKAHHPKPEGNKGDHGAAPDAGEGNQGPVDQTPDGPDEDEFVLPPGVPRVNVPFFKTSNKKPKGRKGGDGPADGPDGADLYNVPQDSPTVRFLIVSVVLVLVVAAVTLYLKKRRRAGYTTMRETTPLRLVA